MIDAEEIKNWKYFCCLEAIVVIMPFDELQLPVLFPTILPFLEMRRRDPSQSIKIVTTIFHLWRRKGIMPSVDLRTTKTWTCTVTMTALTCQSFWKRRPTLGSHGHRPSLKYSTTCHFPAPFSLNRPLEQPLADFKNWRQRNFLNAASWRLYSGTSTVYLFLLNSLQKYITSEALQWSGKEQSVKSGLDLNLLSTQCNFVRQL